MIFGAHMRLSTEVGKDLAKKTNTFKWLIAGLVIVVISILLFLAGFFIRTPSTVPFLSVTWFGDLAWELGKLGLAGGIVATFIRMFHSINFLEEALDKFMWSDIFLSKRNDIDDLWVKLTLFRYRRFSDLDEKERRAFLDKLNSALRSVVGREEEQTVRNHKRIIDIDWKDKELGLIQIHENQSYDIIPKNTDKFKIVTRVTTAGNMKVTDYNIIKDEIFLVSGSGQQKVDFSTKAVDDHIEITYELSGALVYKLKRERIVSWVLDKDPVLSVTSRHVCDGSVVEVNCTPKNLRTRFRENGIRKCFHDDMADAQKASRPGDQRQVCTEILLPGNGFSLYIEQVP